MLLNLLKVKESVNPSVFSKTVACQPPLFVEFSRQEYWSGLPFPWDSLVAQMVKHLSTIQETQVQSLGWEDPLVKEMATHSSTLAWKIPWMEEPGGPHSMGSLRVRHD